MGCETALQTPFHLTNLTLCAHYGATPLSLSPQPLTGTVLSVSMTFTISHTSCKWNRTAFVFFLLNIMSSSFIHVVVYGRIPFLVKAE